MSVHPLESLSALLDDELPPAERRAVEEHVAACPSCARYLHEIGAVDALARDLPPAGAPEGYLEALPGRVRHRITADRPASRRAPWVWPLAAGIALAVLSPIVLRQQRPRDAGVPDLPAVVMEQAPAPVVKDEPAAPAPTMAAEAPRPQSTGDRVVVEPLARSRAPRREAGAAPKMRDAFAVPPPAAPAKEEDRARQYANAAPAVAGASAAAPTEQETLTASARDEGLARSAGALSERVDAVDSLKKADAPRPAAAEDKRAADDDRAFRAAASLPVSSVEEARRAREAWRRFVSLHPAGPRADEGRVRGIESAAAVFRLTRDPADRAIAEREGRAYLAVPGAPQAARVREALRLLDGG